jgi:hypothetical protein
MKFYIVSAHLNLVVRFQLNSFCDSVNAIEFQKMIMDRVENEKVTNLLKMLEIED